MGIERWARLSIAAIMRALAAAAGLSAFFGALFLVVGQREIAAPFLLATTIELGLVVVGVTWWLLVRAHPGSG